MKWMMEAAAAAAAAAADGWMEGRQCDASEGDVPRFEGFLRLTSPTSSPQRRMLLIHSTPSRVQSTNKW